MNPCSSDALRSTSFNHFLKQKLQEFTAWISENGLDPTPPVEESISLNINSSFLELNATYWNTTAMRIADTSEDSVSSDLLESRFSFTLYLRDVVLLGTVCSNYILSLISEFTNKFLQEHTSPSEA
jgi:hypothetical protein